MWHITIHCNIYHTSCPETVLSDLFKWHNWKLLSSVVIVTLQETSCLPGEALTQLRRTFSDAQTLWVKALLHGVSAVSPGCFSFVASVMETKPEHRWTDQYFSINNVEILENMMNHERCHLITSLFLKKNTIQYVMDGNPPWLCMGYSHTAIQHHVHI